MGIWSLLMKKSKKENKRFIWKIFSILFFSFMFVCLENRLRINPDSLFSPLLKFCRLKKEKSTTIVWASFEKSKISVLLFTAESVRREIDGWWLPASLLNSKSTTLKLTSIVRCSLVVRHKRACSTYQWEWHHAAAENQHVCVCLGKTCHQSQSSLRL